MHRHCWCLLLMTVVILGHGRMHLHAQDTHTPVFRTEATLVSVDVVVRDASGEIVRDLTQRDFTITENGMPQQIQTLTFQEISDDVRATPQRIHLLAGLDEQHRANRSAVGTRDTTPSREPSDTKTVAGRRLLVLLFDVSSMQADDLQRAVDSANEFITRRMRAADLVAVVAVGSGVEVLADFTNHREDIEVALTRVAVMDGSEQSRDSDPDGDASGEDEHDSAVESGLESFSNDTRLRALKALAEALSPIVQKKAVIYFSAGMTRGGADNQVALRATTNAAVRANVAIYPVDVRGLEAVVPVGDATQASGRGVSLFTGDAVQRQFMAFAGSVETLTTLAADTGSRLFSNSNSFEEAFARVQRDLSAYYLIGYASAIATKDGRFRRIDVRVARPAARVEARAGYYAERDFRHTTSRDRGAELDAQVAADVSATELPMIVWTGSFRDTTARLAVSIAAAIPGSAVPVSTGAKVANVDVRGVVRDQRGGIVARLRDTLTLEAGSAPTLAGRQVLYLSHVTLPPGHFSVKIVTRENSVGTVGSFESPLVVPEFGGDAPSISSLVFSTQQAAVRPDRSVQPLARGATHPVPNVTRVVSRRQRMSVFYEVYDPASVGPGPDVRTSLACFRGAVKVYETPVLERTTLDDPSRHAMRVRLEIPEDTLTAGAYTCQVNVIDSVAGRVAFPRLSFLVTER